MTPRRRPSRWFWPATRFLWLVAFALLIQWFAHILVYLALGPQP